MTGPMKQGWHHSGANNPAKGQDPGMMVDITHERDKHYAKVEVKTVT